MVRDGLMRIVLLVAIAMAGTLFIACGGDDDDEASDSSDSMNMSDSMDMGDETFAFGYPGDPADADRTIDIEASDTLKFDPDAVTVQVGETVTFRVHNAGDNTHEFVLGTEEEQEDHEHEMQEMAESGSGMHMADEANALDLPAGETKEISWTFTEPGEMFFGCHEPAHYDAGMKGTITVE
jgi:uncharacterized cupredoxin-like copper-binding protein